MHLRFPRNIRSFRGHGLVEQDLRARTGEKVLVQHILRRRQDDDRVRVIKNGSMRVSQGSFRRGREGGGRAGGRHHSLKQSLK